MLGAQGLQQGGGPTASSANDSQVNVSRIRLSSKFDLAIESADKRLTDLVVYVDKALEKVTRMINHSPDEENLPKIKDDLDKHKEAAKAYLTETYKARLMTMRVTLGSASTELAVKNVGDELKDFVKTMNKEAVKAAMDYVRSFNRTSGNIAKKGSAARGLSRAPQVKVGCPLWQFVMRDIGKDELNISESIFEAKGGFRPASMAMTDMQSYETVQNAPICKRALNKLGLALKQGSVETACQPFSGGKQVLKRFDEQLAACVGTEVRSKCALPRADWSPAIFQVEAYGTSKVGINVGWPSYGLMQCNVVMSGGLGVLGLRTDRVPGATFRDKRDTVLRMGFESLSQLVEDGGWYIRFKDGVDHTGKSVVVIPTGYLIVTCGDDARVLRWSLVADDADTQRAKFTLKNLVESFPEFSAPEGPNMQLARHLGVVS